MRLQFLNIATHHISSRTAFLYKTEILLLNHFYSIVNTSVKTYNKQPFFIVVLAELNSDTLNVIQRAYSMNEVK